jgi:proteasome lid subunit RPN8/RPN11
VALLLGAAAFQEIVNHAARAYPEECCGALVGALDGDDRHVSAAWPIANVAAASAESFVVDPADYRQVEQRAHESGVALVGFYHSHPDAPAAPSANDLAQAWPHFSYLIVSVAASGQGSLTCWRLRDDRSTFDNEEITWLAS